MRIYMARVEEEPDKDDQLMQGKNTEAPAISEVVFFQLLLY